MNGLSEMIHCGNLTFWVRLCVVLVVCSLVTGQNWALNKLIPVDYNKYQVPLQNNLNNGKFKCRDREDI